jgi:hypothetical protein
MSALRRVGLAVLLAWGVCGPASQAAAPQEGASTLRGSAGWTS